MRHLDLVAHRIPGARPFPYVCILQSDAAGGVERIVAPVALSGYDGVLAPEVEIGGRRYRVLLRALNPVPRRMLGATVASAEPWRDDITRGLDLLFLGV